MRIGELAGQTGASVRSLRYYEEHALLTARRTATGQRVYGADAVERVRLLKQLYAAGLSSATIAALLPCVDAPSSHATAEAVAVLRREHARVSEQLAELHSVLDQLEYMIAATSGSVAC